MQIKQTVLLIVSCRALSIESSSLCWLIVHMSRWSQQLKNMQNGPSKTHCFDDLKSETIMSNAVECDQQRVWRSDRLAIDAAREHSFDARVCWA